MLLNICYVGIGGFFGAIARYLISRLNPKDYGIPWGTALINISGSFLLGLLVAKLGDNFGNSLGLLLGTGFMGAFTTFSTFSFEVALLGEKKRSIAVTYLFVTIFLGILAAVLGMHFGKY